MCNRVFSSSVLHLLEGNFMLRHSVLFAQVHFCISDDVAHQRNITTALVTTFIYLVKPLMLRLLHITYNSYSANSEI